MNDTEWNSLVADLRNVDNASAFLTAVECLHRTASAEDIPRLKTLLSDDSFLVREAAAWPLSELAGVEVLSDLFRAFQRGFDEGHDNDGFSTALTELAAARWNSGGAA